MPVLQIEHGVGDFERWKERAFDSDPIGRERGGVRRYRVSRTSDDANYVVVDLEFDTMTEAESFRTALEELWGRVEGDLGLSTPRARILETVEAAEY